MSTWAADFNAMHAALATVPGLVELPSAASVAAPLTMTQQGNIGYALFFEATAWTDDRQRRKIRTTHDVAIDLVSMLRQTQRESETLAAMLDMEQAVLAVLLERGVVPSANLTYLGSARAYSAERNYLQTRLTFALAGTNDTGANT